MSADFDKALQMNLDADLAYLVPFTLGSTKFEMGQYEYALADFDETLRLAPDFAYATSIEAM